jgi:hypothetical protein
MTRPVLLVLRWVALVMAMILPFALAAQESAPEEPVADAPAADVADSSLADILITTPDGVTEVQVGAYIQRLRNVSPRDGSFELDAWLWFRWEGDAVRPYETFEFVNGVITDRSEAQVEIDVDRNYATLRVWATIFHDFDVRRYPMDNHLLRINLEDSNWDESTLVYVPDVEATALDPEVSVPGWASSLPTPTVEPHTYPTTLGLRSADGEFATYSRLILPISLERTSYSVLFKSFWVSFLAVVLGLLAFLVKADDLDARFGMGVGSIFAASANAFILSDTLPATNFITLAEQINLIAVGVIFSTVFISIWSLRLRYAGRDEDSLRLDRIALITFAAIFVALVLLVVNFDLSGGPPVDYAANAGG